VRTPARILVVDDVRANVEIVEARLASQGFEIIAAVDGEEALGKVRECLPDLILLDVMMPRLDGIETTIRLKADAGLPFIPIILLTAKADTRDVVAGLQAGADDYLTKPVDHAALVARVRSMLRIKALHDEVEQQAQRLAEWNSRLEERVAAQVAELERMGGLRRFLAPQVADALLSAGGEAVLESHRRDIVVLFCDLRGFTAFSETSEPEEVMTVLSEFHGALGPLVHEHEGTLDRFMGDGMMVFFNDPVPCPDAPERAVRLAIAMREAVARLAAGWSRRGYRIGLGIGVAQGYATLGRIGFPGRLDYSAIGTVTNLAARLCGAAEDGQILVTSRIAAAAAGLATFVPTGDLALKGISRPVEAFNIAP
jgi:class 3 adenylate cyclase